MLTLKTCSTCCLVFLSFLDKFYIFHRKISYWYKLCYFVFDTVSPTACMHTAISSYIQTLLELIKLEKCAPYYIASQPSNYIITFYCRVLKILKSLLILTEKYTHNVQKIMYLKLMIRLQKVILSWGIVYWVNVILSITVARRCLPRFLDLPENSQNLRFNSSSSLLALANMSRDFSLKEVFLNISVRSIVDGVLWVTYCL